MAVNRGLYVPINTTGNVGTTELEARLAQAGQFEHNAAGVPRSGLLVPAGTSQTTVVTGAANMSYNLAACYPVINTAANDGVYTFSATGTTNVATTAAPATNSRIDLLWVKQNDKSKGDADNLAVFGVTQGVSATSPVAPALPARAMEVARATILSTTTATNTAVITQTFTYAALKGTPIPVRNTTDRATITAPTLGQKVQRLDVTTELVALEDWNGTTWLPQFSYAEYASNSFGVSGGLVNWDAGPQTLQSGNTWNNTFSNTSGALSGAVNITENGFYSVQCTVVPTSNLGRVAIILKNGSGQTLGAGTTDGIIWEVSATTTRWLSAGSYVRGVVLFQNGGTVNSSFVLMKHKGKW